MDARIILGGQQPDFVNALARGQQAGFAARESNVMRNYGGAALQGDQNALAQLASVNPAGAQALQAGQQNMAFNAEEMQMKRAEIAERTRQHAANMSAEQRRQESEQLKGILMGAIPLFKSGDEQAYNAWLQKNDVDPSQFPMSDFPSIVPQVMGVLDALDEPATEYGVQDGQFYDKNNPGAGAQPIPGLRQDAPGPQSPQGKLAADLAAGLISPEQYNAANEKTGMRVQSDGNGGFTFEQGPGVTSGSLPKTTEGEKSSSGYLSRMRASEAILDGLEGGGDQARRSLASLLVAGTDFEGLVLSGEQERILQAQRDWVRAKLRKESGAVIGADEMAEEIRTYFPLPGEDDATAKQKRAARKQAERQFEIMAGAAAPQAGEAAPSVEKFDPKTPDFSTMSDQELQDYIARGGQ